MAIVRSTRQLLWCFILVSLCATGTARSVPSAVAQSLSCADFDAWVWAQSFLVLHPDINAALDPDGNGEACDSLRGVEGFAPVVWTSGVPTTAYAAELLGIVDGDSILANIDGVAEEVRLYRSDAPEFEPPECGAQDAAYALQQLLGSNDQGARIYIEHDQTLRDQYGRLLAYLWIVVDGQPYLVNEAMVRSGWSADKDYGDRLYAPQMSVAGEFARVYSVGAYRICGPFGPSSPSSQAAPSSQDQQAPMQIAAQQTGSCDSSYPDFCLAPAWEIGDLDCGDIPYSHFTVYPPDSHNFDGNFDGEGCEGPR